MPPSNAKYDFAHSAAGEIHQQQQNIVTKLLPLVTCNQYSYDLIQNNGQRVFSIKKELHPTPPPKGSEIFVGKLPRDIFEDELVPLFSSVGSIYKLRLMIDFAGKTRGYAFVTYFSIEEANKAVKALDNMEVRPGRRIGVYKSVDNCRLFMGNIPTDKTEADVWEALHPLVEGLREIIMYRAHNSCFENRGFVFLEFNDHRMAAMARRKLTPGSVFLWGTPIMVDWADPVPEVDPEIMAKVTKLYIRNLDVSMDVDELKKVLYQLLPPEKIVHAHKILDYAFVHFATREDAEHALATLQGKNVKNLQMEVSWARPKMYSKSNRITREPDNYCTSLPPRMRRIVQSKLKKTPGSYGSKNFNALGRNRSNSSTSSSTCSLVQSMNLLTVSPPMPVPMPMVGYDNRFFQSHF